MGRNKNIKMRTAKRRELAPQREKLRAKRAEKHIAKYAGNSKSSAAKRGLSR